MAKYCPECGTSTIRGFVGGRERDVCPEGHFVQFAKVKLGVGALIFHDEQVLLVERGIPPVGIWTLPSGHVEEYEALDAAIVREVREEVGLEVAPTGIVFVRNMLEHGASDIYLIFLCDFDPQQELAPDGFEATRAAFVAPSRFESLHVSPYTRWFVETFLANRPQPWRWLRTPHDSPTTRIFSVAKA